MANKLKMKPTYVLAAWCMHVGLLIAIAIGAIVGIVVGCIFLLTVFIFRKRFDFSRQRPYHHSSLFTKEKHDFRPQMQNSKRSAEANEGIRSRHRKDVVWKLNLGVSRLPTD